MTLRNQKGVALITVLLMISLLSLIGIAAMQAASMQTRIARAQQQMDFARSIADAGLQHLQTYLDSAHPNYGLPIPSSYSIDGNTCVISASGPTIDESIYSLTSTYTHESGSNSILSGYVRLPVAAAFAAGSFSVHSGSTVSGADLCGDEDRLNTFIGQIDIGALIDGLEDYDDTHPGYFDVDEGGGNKTNKKYGDFGNCTPEEMHVVYYNGNTNWKSNSEGCGLMLVRGNLIITGDWSGLILASGSIDVGNKGTVHGGIVTGSDSSTSHKHADLQWCSTTARWANDLTRETGAHLWFSRWTDL